MLVINCKGLLGVWQGLIKQALSSQFPMIPNREAMRFAHDLSD